MVRKVVLPNTPDLVKSYIAGKSINKLASENGVGRYAMARILRDEGLVLRTQSEAEKIKWSLMTAKQRANQVRASHAATVGRHVSEREIVLRAKTREVNWTKHSSRNEIRLLAMLDWSDCITPQKAVGIYNIDIALNRFSIAVLWESLLA